MDNAPVTARVHSYFDSGPSLGAHIGRGRVGSRRLRRISTARNDIEQVFQHHEMDPRAEHVWVTDVQVWGDRQCAGLLLGWRQRKGQWEGWVITAQVPTP